METSNEYVRLMEIREVLSVYICESRNSISDEKIVYNLEGKGTCQDIYLKRDLPSLLSISLLTL